MTERMGIAVDVGCLSTLATQGLVVPIPMTGGASKLFPHRAARGSAAHIGGWLYRGGGRYGSMLPGMHSSVAAARAIAGRALRKILAAGDCALARPVISKAVERNIRSIYGYPATVRHNGEFWIVDWPHSSVPTEVPWHFPTPQFEEDFARDLFFQEYTPREGEVIFDVGAGIGTELMLFSRVVGSKGHVFAIEADPATFTWLQRRRDVNRLENTTLLEMAASDEPGDVYISTEGFYDGHFITKDYRAGQCVKAITLDDLVAEHGLTRVDYLKMNIEGAERAALNGMRHSIGIVRNVCIGCHDFLADTGGGDWMRTKAFVRAYLDEHGFEVIERRPDDQKDYARDYLYGRRR